MLDQKRAEEAAVYVREYQKSGYRMGAKRLEDVNRLLAGTTKGSYLDVSTGRGEALQIAESLGFSPVQGTETVPDLLNERTVHAYSVSLPFPDQSFGFVTCFDVMEHLIEKDLVPTIIELCRVAKREIIISWADFVSTEWGGGLDLHISKRSPEEAERLLRDAAKGWQVRQDGTAGHAAAFRLTRA